MNCLEVLKGPNLPSSLVFHTRTSTAASPRARVNSVTSASRNSAFHRPIDCSDTFSLRAASAIVISPARIDSTIRIFFSAGITGGLDIEVKSLRHRPILH